MDKTYKNQVQKTLHEVQRYNRHILPLVRTPMGNKRIQKRALVPTLRKNRKTIKNLRRKNYIMYNEVKEDSLAVQDYEQKLEREDEIWRSRLWIAQTLGGNYKLFIKTTVTNKGTGQTREKKTVSTLLNRRSKITQKLLGLNQFKRKDLPNIQTNTEHHVKLLSKANKNMKTEEELVNEISKEFQNQLQNADLEKAVKKEANQ